MFAAVRSVGLALLSAALVRAMIRRPIMDLPSGRKAHVRPTPTAGGVGVIGACMAAIALFPVLRDPPVLLGLAAAFGLGLVGLVDDVRDRGVAVKLGAQILAAILAVAVALPDWGLAERGLAEWGLPGWGLAGAALAVAWVVFLTNVFNFMDGRDGLAAGSGLLAALFLAAAAPSGSATGIVALALAAGLAGFLPFNLPPARIFLGDAGSQFCGFLLALLGLRLAAEPGVPQAGWLLPMLLWGMILDVTLTLFRRAWAGSRILSAHREHLYQRAAAQDGVVSLIYWGLVLLGGGAWQLRGWGGG